jgi:hypothetical protein
VAEQLDLVVIGVASFLIVVAFIGRVVDDILAVALAFAGAAEPLALRPARSGSVTAITMAPRPILVLPTVSVPIDHDAEGARV